MYSGFGLNIAVTCILVCSLTSAAKAQLASDKSLTGIYNKKINEKLAEKNTSKQFFKPLQKERNLPSTKSSLKDVAKFKIKNPETVSHNNSTQSDEKKKNKLPSNSPTLKQKGTPATKSPKIPLR
jgi:hypothetical protein